MKLDKKVIESGIVAAFALAVASSSVLGPSEAAFTNQYTRSYETNVMPIKNLQEDVTLVKTDRSIVSVAFDKDSLTTIKEDEVKSYIKREGSKRTAGVSNIAAVLPEKEEQVETAETVEENTEEVVNETQEAVAEEAEEKEKTQEQETASKSETEESETEVKEEQKELAAGEQKEEAVSEWETKLMPDVDEYLNVRAEANPDAEVVGKLYKGSEAEIVEAGDEWSKIRSGNVEGYVKNEYCVFDDEAENLAGELGTTYATAMTDGLRVRAEASAEEGTKILDVLEEGKKIEVDTEAESIDGWVAVQVDEQQAYISEEFVTVELELGEGITIEEEQAAIEAAERERAEREAAEAAANAAAASAATSSSSASSAPVQNTAVAASYDDVTLLGALIQCEAGSESYDGQLAVGAVVMNRLRNGYAGSISGVIYQSGQFTPASSGALASRLASGVSGSCLQAAQEAINGADNVGGATSFRHVSSGRGGIVIGNHVFF